MLTTQIIAKKRDRQALSADEIRFMIAGMLDGSIPDYQMSAWCMAVLCRGMNARETAQLTQCMLESGESLKRVSDRPRVDKHSTGGLGDKVSLILAPLLACFDLEVPMLSGRGLGITGGTLDKLEAYPGFRCDLSESEVRNQLLELGCVITGTTPQIAPADRKLYGLRDVTGTVPSVPLITSSILSKKLAETLDALVLDVKFGSGAFMTDMQAAQELADSLTATASQLKLRAISILSDMNQPLGQMVGNACEVNEAVDTLKGQGPDDVKQLTLRLSAELLLATGKFDHLPQAEESLKRCLEDGRAYERYCQMMRAQGVRVNAPLPVESCQLVTSHDGGWLESIDGQLLGHSVIALGGGRRVLEDKLNHRVGLKMCVRVGERVERGQPLVEVYCDDASRSAAATQMILQALRFSEAPVESLPLLPEIS